MADGGRCRRDRRDLEVHGGRRTDPAGVVENVKKAAPLLKKAYDLTGSVPDEAAFAETDAGDLRGAPTWQADSWKRS